MTTPVRSATRPSPIMLLEQLARYWSLVTQWPGGLVAADRDLSHLANIHAGPMPTSARRLNPSCSLILTPAPAPDPLEPTVNIGVTASARGGTSDEILALLWDLMSTVVRPDDQPFVYAPRAHAGTVQLGGIIGPPTIQHFGESATLGVWRVLRLDLLNQPQIINAVAGVGGTNEGQTSAEFSFIATCVAAVLPKPAEALTINIVSGVGTVQLLDDELTLTRIGTPAITIDLTAAADDTVGELAAHNVGPHFTLTNLNGAVAGRSCLDLVPIAHPLAVEVVGGAQKLYVWA